MLAHCRRARDGARASAIVISTLVVFLEVAVQPSCCGLGGANYSFRRGFGTLSVGISL
jgi:hypothetical protein